MRILFPFDGAEGSSNAVRYVAELVKRVDGAELEVLYVINRKAIEECSVGSEFFDTKTLRSMLYTEACSKGEDAAKKAKELFAKEGLDIHLTVGEGHEIAESIVDEAFNFRADLIIMATARMGRRISLGSVTDSVLRITHCPIMVVTPNSSMEAGFGKFLVPLDGSTPSRRAFAHALDMAKDLGASIEALYVVDEGVINYSSAVAGVRDDNWEKVVQSFEEEGKTKLAGVLKAAEGTGVEITSKVLIGPPARTVVKEAQEQGSDLIIMGSRGLGGVSRLFLGSVTGGVISRSDSPILVVT